MIRPHAHSQSGFVALVAILGIIALLGLAALTVDIGRMAVAAQRAQDIADAAALAGAYELPDVGTAGTKMDAIVQVNNAHESWPQVTVDSDEDIVYYHPGDQIEGYGTLDSGEHAVQVTARVDELNYFARILGQNEMHVARTATARVYQGDGVLPCLFAGDESWMNGLVINGSHMDVHGDIHSNTRVVINGSHQTVRGSLEWRNDLTVNGAHQDFQSGTHEGDIQAYPVEYTWEQYSDWDTEVSNIYVNSAGQEMEFGHTHVTGDVVINGAHFHGHDGILMVDGDVIFNGSHHTLENVTIIAKGSITFNGAAQHLSPNVDGLALMSLSSHYSGAITYNGAHQMSEGTLFAPNGGITYNGAHQETRNGSIIGKHIRANGAHFALHGTETTAAGEKIIRLIR